MRLLVDGYNLCHALGLLQAKAGSPARAGPHELEKARLQLLGRLAAVCGDKDAVTVVFDAAGALPGSTADDWHQGVHILYAQRRSADDLIEDLIAHDSDPRRLTVISDDRRLRQAARHRHCEVWGSEQFEAEMARHQRRRIEQARPPQDKPEAVSERDRQLWLEAFGDADNELTRKLSD
jgi:predicted RNA-binding protein with PIN domain